MVARCRVVLSIYLLFTMNHFNMKSMNELPISNLNFYRMIFSVYLIRKALDLLLTSSTFLAPLVGC